MEGEYQRFACQRAHGQPGHLIKSAAQKADVQPLLEEHIDLPFADVFRETNHHFGVCAPVAENRVTKKWMERCRNRKSYPQRSCAARRNSLDFLGGLGDIRENA